MAVREVEFIKKYLGLQCTPDSEIRRVCNGTFLHAKVRLHFALDDLKAEIFSSLPEWVRRLCR